VPITLSSSRRCKSPPPRASNPPTSRHTNPPATRREAPLGNEADSAIREALSRGDRDAAFDRLVAEHRQPITRLVHRLLGWPAETEDAVQDVFLAAWRKLDSFRGDASVATWLTRIAINRCRSIQRRQWVRAKWLRQAREAATDASPNAGPQQRADDQETVDALRAAIRQLPQRDREVIVLHYLDEHSADEMAATLGVKKNAIEVRLHRARKRLRGVMNGQLGS
jgi:RNA polymerase sigma-70 factor (ECF subfamily)